MRHFQILKLRYRIYCQLRRSSKFHVLLMWPLTSQFSENYCQLSQLVTCGLKWSSRATQESWSVWVFWSLGCSCHWTGLDCLFPSGGRCEVWDDIWPVTLQHGPGSTNPPLRRSPSWLFRWSGWGGSWQVRLRQDSAIKDLSLFPRSLF